MKITPVEIRQHKFNKSLFGYNSGDVDAFINLVADVLETALRQISTTEEGFKTLEKEHSRLAEMESKLRDTLVTAKETSDKAIEDSKEEAKKIIENAQRTAEQTLEDVTRERKEIEEQIARQKIQKDLFVVKMKNLIRSQSEILELFEDDKEQDTTL